MFAVQFYQHMIFLKNILKSFFSFYPNAIKLKFEELD